MAETIHCDAAKDEDEEDEDDGKYCCEELAAGFPLVAGPCPLG